MHCPEIKTFFNIRFGKLAPKPKKINIPRILRNISSSKKIPPSQLENVLYPYHSYYSLRIIFFFLFEIFPLRINFPPSKKFFSFATIDQTRGGGWIDGIIRDIDMVNIRDTAMEGRAGARKEG